MASMTETVVDKAAAMRDGVSTMFGKSTDLASQIGETIGDTSTELVNSLAKSVKRNPLMAIGIAFAGGLLIGGTALLFMRRGKRR